MGLRWGTEVAQGHSEPFLFSLGHRTFSPSPGEGHSPLVPGKDVARSVSRPPLEPTLVNCPVAGVPPCCEAPIQLTFMMQESWHMPSDSGYTPTLTATHLIKVLPWLEYRDMKSLC